MDCSLVFTDKTVGSWGTRGVRQTDVHSTDTEILTEKTQWKLRENTREDTDAQPWPWQYTPPPTRGTADFPPGRRGTPSRGEGQGLEKGSRGRAWGPRRRTEGVWRVIRRLSQRVESRRASTTATGPLWRLVMKAKTKHSRAIICNRVKMHEVIQPCPLPQNGNSRGGTMSVSRTCLNCHFL